VDFPATFDEPLMNPGGVAMRRRGPGYYDLDVPLETSQRRSPPGNSTDVPCDTVHGLGP